MQVKGLKVWLRQILRVFPSVISHYSNNWSQFHCWSKEKSFLCWHLLCVLFALGLHMSTCWLHSRQISVFKVNFQAAELSGNFKLSALSSYPVSFSSPCALPLASAWACPRGFRIMWNSCCLLWRWQTSQGCNEENVGLGVWEIVAVLDDVIFLQRKLYFLLASSERKNRSCLSNQEWRWGSTES